MGYERERYERAMRPHRYVAFCEGKEIGSGPTEIEAASVASVHAKITGELPWQRHRTWRALYEGRLYEIRKLRQARPAPDYIRRDQRHG